LEGGFIFQNPVKQKYKDVHGNRDAVSRAGQLAVVQDLGQRAWVVGAMLQIQGGGRGDVSKFEPLGTWN
jgi:hypothetical protein